MAPLTIVAVLVSLLVCLLSYYVFGRKDEEEEEVDEEPEPEPEPVERLSKKIRREQMLKLKQSNKDKKRVKGHPLCVFSNKAHHGAVNTVCFSPNGKIMASSGSDSMVQLYTGFAEGKAMKAADVVTKQIMLAIPPSGSGLPVNDTASSISLGGGYLVASLSRTKTVRAYKLSDHLGGKKAPYPEPKNLGTSHPTDEVTYTHVSPKADFVITSSEGTQIMVRSFGSGKEIDTVNTNQIKNHCTALTPDGKFFACGTFASEVKVWTVNSTTAGRDAVARAMTASGHRSGIYSLGFTSDSTKMATVSKDGTWRLFNIDVRFRQQEDVRCIALGKSELGTELSQVAVCSWGEKVVVVVAASAHLEFIQVDLSKPCGKPDKMEQSHTVLDTITTAHSSTISTMAFSPDGRYLATGASDNFVRVWRNPGYADE